MVVRMRGNGAHVRRQWRHQASSHPFKNIQSIDSRRLKAAAGIAFAILGFAALAGQSGQAAAAASDVEARSTGVTLAAARLPAEDQTAAGPAENEVLAGAKQSVTQAVTPAVTPAATEASKPADAPKAEASKAEPARKPDWWKQQGEVAPVAGLDQVQMNNATKIVETARSMGLGRDAQIIAVATAMQESTLYNRASTVYPESYEVPHEGDGSDYDSVGLFQQRSSTGWGAVTELMKPEFATKQFLKALIQIPDWQDLPLTVAAQTVQGSAFPDHYAKHQGNATTVVDAINGA
jgi:hypothetical protein